MKNSNILSLLLGASIAATSMPLFHNVTNATKTVSKWEYEIGYVQRPHLLNDKDEVLEAMKERGNNGWEYMGPYCPDGMNGNWYMWRRQK